MPAAGAAEFPTKPITLVIGFAPGGPSDVMARILTKKMEEILKQPVVIENRAGAGGGIAANAVARAAPDGYTMLFVVGAFVTNPHLYKLPWDPLKDFVPVAQMNQLQVILLASAKFPPATLAEVMEQIRGKPGTVKCAWGGSILLGLACEVLKLDGKADITVVPYKGGAPAMNDLIGGHVDLMIDVMNTAVPQIKAGRVKPIAVANPSRGKAPFADLPAMSEVVPGFEMVPWQGVVMPAGTPKEIAARMNREIIAALQTADMKQKYLESGLEAVTLTPEQFGEMMQRDYVKYGRIIRAANIKVD
jgi:tripartite-type tricarboxylate transporter receptor subunit TctC